MYRYQYCGLGTNLKKRLSRGDKDLNEADHILEQRAWNRFKSKDSSLKEKAVAWGVTTAMKAKLKIGGSCGYKAAIKAAKNIFAGLSALEALTGGVANVVKIADELNRKTPTHLGNGVYLAPYKGNSYKIVTPNKTGGEVENTAQICLLSMQTNNLISNIKPGCNTIGFRNMIGQIENLIIPTGSYKLEDLESVTNKFMPGYVTHFKLKANSNILKCMISCSHEIDLSVKNSVAKLFGFINVFYTTCVTHESENTVNIMKVNCIKVECYLIVGSFCDGTLSQITHDLLNLTQLCLQDIRSMRYLDTQCFTDSLYIVISTSFFDPAIHDILPFF
ncbi:Uncharacterized protein FWK35_00027095 [Aphis craccivora]|uniref:Uncharacterized protein n=1 Tax=Aphis craccivora TaxID=307492 RepID=A0A6G0W577_APHCR|nr:Uncharacterized protein FWK35_00027095 [Aphis craccivora]